VACGFVFRRKFNALDSVLLTCDQKSSFDRSGVVLSVALNLTPELWPDAEIVFIPVAKLEQDANFGCGHLSSNRSFHRALNDGFHHFRLCLG
jgi:hypothetical protein